jgi:drug/metabolite transporter (DMT)-like permease
VIFLGVTLLLAAVASWVYACVCFARDTAMYDHMGASFGFTAIWIFGAGFLFFALLVLRGPSSTPIVIPIAVIVAGKVIEWFVLGPIVDRTQDRNQKGPPA